jgi:hypothetical protein
VGKAHAAIALAAALLAPSAAEAATTTVGFDDLAPGTNVTTQYLDAGGASQGLEFGKFNGKSERVPPQVEQVPAGQANSGSQVGDIYESAGEFSESRTWATFPFQKNLVRVFVGLESPGSTPVTLTAYGNNAQPLDSQTKTVTSGTGYKTMLEVTGPTSLNPTIKFIRVAPPNRPGAGSRS